jgi:hypothetical protein
LIALLQAVAGLLSGLSLVYLSLLVRGLRRLLGVQVLSAGKIGQEKGDFTFQCWPGVLKVQRIEVSGF